MGKATREHTQAHRLQRRDRVRREFPFAARLFENRDLARAFVESAPFTRVLIEMGLSPEPDMGVANHDACIAILKDTLGIATLSDAEFEHALRLATPPECRETGH